MNVAIFAASPGALARVFVQAHVQDLAREGVRIALVVLDENARKKQRFLQHAIAVARRQARVAGCSTLNSVFRIAAYKLLTHSGSQTPEVLPDFPGSTDTVRVPTINSPAAVEAVRQRNCALICLMGTRILTEVTLAAVSVPVINIHSSDPRMIRGGPVVVWEILANQASISLTVHEVVEQLDAGAILLQKPHPILYAPCLGATVRQTMKSAQPVVAEMFRDVILDFHRKVGRPQQYTPGQLHVTPSIWQTIHARSLCRRRAAAAASH